MPAVGRKQKPPGHAINRNATLEWTEVPDTPFKGGPRLPKERRNGKPWPPGCAQKWAAWSTMPHCALWKATDWESALDSLEVAATMMLESHDPRRSSELRNREKVMGTTLDFRRDIRVRYVDPPQDGPKVAVL